MFLLKTKAALPARCLSRMGIPTVSDDLSLTPSIYMMEEQTHKLSPDVYMCTMFSPTFTTNNVFLKIHIGQIFISASPWFASCLLSDQLC